MANKSYCFWELRLQQLIAHVWLRLFTYQICGRDAQLLFESFVISITAARLIPIGGGGEVGVGSCLIRQSFLLDG